MIDIAGAKDQGGIAKFSCKSVRVFLALAPQCKSVKVLMPERCERQRPKASNASPKNLISRG
jgi:hypothetical protein